MDLIKLSNKFLGLPKWVKIIGVLVLLTGIGWGVKSKFFTTMATTKYQTTKVEKGTLVASVSASGSITSSNYTEISTKASGTVTKVYVSNGDRVKKGQKIADLALDEYGQERQAAAYLAYTTANVAVKTAIKAQTDADIAMWQARQSRIDAQDTLDKKNRGEQNSKTNLPYTENERAIIDKTIVQAEQGFAAAETKYTTARAGIVDAKAKVTAAWRDYQEVAGTITAPADGIVSGLTLAGGTVIATEESTSAVSRTVVSQTLGKISNPEGQLQATVNVTQMDVVKIAANQKVSLTLDAYPDKTFTGKVLSIDTSGNTTSNVTSYPVTILLDQTSITIYPKMAVTTSIIYLVEPNVLMIPTTAISTNNGVSTVQILKDGKVTGQNIEIGSSNDSMTVISGLNEGDEVVTGTISASSSSQDDASSDFSIRNQFNNRSTGGSSGTGNVRIMQFGGPGF